MTGEDDKNSAKSRSIRDQAMAVLRETRAKIDPKLLSLMKDKLSKVVMPPVPPETPKKSVFSEEKVAELSRASPVVPPKVAANRGASVYASTEKKAEAAKASDGPEMIPVDRKKVAQIVMEYMKHRQEKGSTH